MTTSFKHWNNTRYRLHFLEETSKWTCHSYEWVTLSARLDPRIHWLNIERIMIFLAYHEIEARKARKISKIHLSGSLFFGSSSYDSLGSNLVIYGIMGNIYLLAWKTGDAAWRWCWTPDVCSLYPVALIMQPSICMPAVVSALVTQLL